MNLKLKIGSDKDDNPGKINSNNFENVIRRYVNIYVSQKHIYVLYRGRTSLEYKNNGYKGDVIEVFDFNGNPVARYSFDKSPVLFAVDEATKKMYGYNSLFEDKILLYD